MAPCKVRWPALLVAAITLALAIPHLDLLFVEAFPTSFYTSPTEFAATAIVRGAKLFAANCVVCHGAEGRGDGPSAKSLPWPPADLTAEHFWAHSDGELFWYLSHGFTAPDGSLAMPGFRNRAVKRGALGPDRLAAHAQRRREHADDRQMGASAADTQFDIACANGRTIDLDDLRARVLRILAMSVDEAPLLEAPAGIDITTVILARKQPAGWKPAACVASEPETWTGIRDPVRCIERGLGRRADTDRSERMDAGGMASW